MPFYNYSCPNCGEFEVQQSIKAPHLEECPNCVGSDKIECVCNDCNKTWIENKSDAHSHCIHCNLNSITIRIPKPKRLISLSSFSLKGGGWSNEGYK